MACNQLCGLNYRGEGTYDASGIQALASAISVNSALTSLNLRKNNLDAEAGKALADALSVNSVLKVLDAWGNFLGDKGVKVLRDAVGEREGFVLLV